MSEKPTEQLRRQRRWLSDMAAVSDALDRLGVPPHTQMRMSEARVAPDEEPCPALMERLGWLEGHVASLRPRTRPPSRPPSRLSVGRLTFAEVFARYLNREPS